jgi:MFS transporter, ACS family, hexuronate transporter
MVASTDERKSSPTLVTVFSEQKRRAQRIGYLSFIYLTFLLRSWTPNYVQDGFLYDLSSLWK